MKVLTNLKHEAFVQAVALGVPASKAYARHVSSGQCNPQTARTEAARLLKRPDISARLVHLQDESAGEVELRFAITRTRWLQRLASIFETAHAQGRFAAATRAAHCLGRACGWFPRTRQAPPSQEEQELRQALAVLGPVVRSYEGQAQPPQDGCAPPVCQIPTEHTPPLGMSVVS